MKIQDVLPNVIVDNGQYQFKNIFYKYNLVEDLEDKYLQVYNISDGQMLEDISYEMYDDPIYYWTIIIVNNITDPIFDLPLPEESIQEIARDQSYVNGSLDLNLYSTNYDTMSTENDTKRNIKVIKREYLSQFLTEIIKRSVNA